MDVKELLEVVLSAESESLVEIGNAYINYKLIELFSAIGFGVFAALTVGFIVIYIAKKTDF